MKHRATVYGLIAIFLTTAQPSFAKNDKGDGDRHDRGRNEQAQRDDRHDRGRKEHAQRNDRHDRDRNEHAQRNDRHDRRDYQARAPQRWHYTGRNYRFEGHDARGAGPNHQFHRGERLSREYRNRYYVVDDWRGHRLSAPPRGYYWVQTGADYVLVAIATGIIVDLLLNH